ncbi:MAG: outer membrane beta-barrel protein [bacterium]
MPNINRRYLIVFLILNCLFLKVYCQKGFSVGTSLSVQNTKLDSRLNKKVETYNAYRPAGNINLQYRFSNKIALQSGIGYMLLTQKTTDFSNNFNYLNVPVYIKLGSYKNNRRFAFTYFGGFNFQYLINANNIYNNEKTNINKYCDSFHYETIVGTGLKYKINDKLEMESYAFISRGCVINKTTSNGFNLSNKNYGIIINMIYELEFQK